MSVATIRPADPEDAAALAQLAERSFREAYLTTNNQTDLDLYCA